MGASAMIGFLGCEAQGQMSQGRTSILWKSAVDVITDKSAHHRDHRGSQCRPGGFTPMTYAYCVAQVISTRMGTSFFTGTVSNDGGSILKSESLVGMVPVMCFSLPSVFTSNGTCW